MAARRQRPLVYATRRAAQAAARLLPGGALVEDLVAQEIVLGHVSRWNDEKWAVYRPGTWRAIARREPGRLRPGGPRTWLVVDFEDLTNRRTDATAHET